MPQTRPPPRPPRDLFALVALAAVLAVLVGGYLLFPWLSRTLGHVDCIASGRVTGC